MKQSTEKYVFIVLCVRTETLAHIKNRASTSSWNCASSKNVVTLVSHLLPTLSHDACGVLRLLTTGIRCTNLISCACYPSPQGDGRSPRNQTSVTQSPLHAGQIWSCRRRGSRRRHALSTRRRGSDVFLSQIVDIISSVTHGC